MGRGALIHYKRTLEGEGSFETTLSSIYPGLVPLSLSVGPRERTLKGPGRERARGCEGERERPSEIIYRNCMEKHKPTQTKQCFIFGEIEKWLPIKHFSVPVRLKLSRFPEFIYTGLRLQFEVCYNITPFYLLTLLEYRQCWDSGVVGGGWLVEVIWWKCTNMLNFSLI